METIESLKEQLQAVQKELAESKNKIKTLAGMISGNADDVKALQAENDELRKDKAESEIVKEQIRFLLNEVDCRIEHGAKHGGHLDYVRDFLKGVMKGEKK